MGSLVPWKFVELTERIKSLLYKKKVRPETIKHLEGNLEEKLYYIEMAIISWIWQQKQNRQMRLHQTLKLLHSKRNIKQREKAAYIMGENVCKSCIW